MQFKDTTTRTGIIELCEDLSKLGPTGISGNTALLQRFTSYINMRYLEVFSTIMSVDKHWKADDFNYTDYPEAPINLVASQRDYTLPVASTGANVATLLRINKVWVLDAEGTRRELSQMEPGEDFDHTASGLPTKYYVDGKSIFLNVLPTASSVTLTGGLIIKFQRTPDAFLSTDDVQQPGFMATHHPLLAIGASAMYMLPVDPSLANQYEQRFLLGLENLKRDYATKDDNTVTRLTPRVTDCE